MKIMNDKQQLKETQENFKWLGYELVYLTYLVNCQFKIYCTLHGKS